MSLFVLIGTVHAASYVVLQENDKDSLLRVSVDGQTVTTIASGVGGFGLAKDAAGNYVIAAKSRLLRVTPSGSVSVIASAPADAEWASVVVDPDGSIVVADGRRPMLWRVSPDGLLINKVAAFPGISYSVPRGISLIQDATSGYWLAVDEGETHFFHITKEGGVTEIPLKTPVPPRAPVAMISDGAGGFVFTVEQISRQELNPAIYRVTTDGSLTKLATLPKSFRYVRGLVLNPISGDLIIAHHTRLSRVSADGSITTLTEHGKVWAPAAVIFEPDSN